MKTYSLKEGKAEIYIGIFFLIVGILLLTLIIPSQIAFIEGAYPQPRFFPNLISALMAVLGVCLFAEGYKKHKKNAEGQDVYTTSWQELRLVLVTFATLVVYVVAMNFIPYLPATIIATGFLVTIYGQKSKVKIVATALIVPIVIYVGLTYGLHVMLP